MVQNITLFAVLIYEIVGPTLTKISLEKAGEIKPEGKTSARGHKHEPVIVSAAATESAPETVGAGAEKK